MATFDDLVKQVLAPEPVQDSLAQVSPQIQQNVAQASVATHQRVDQLAPQDLYSIGARRQNPGLEGTGPLSEFERDMATLSPTQLFAKYGDQAGRMIEDRIRGQSQYIGDVTANRTVEEAISDSVAGAATGLVGGLAGTSALALSLYGRGLPHTAEAIRDFAPRTADLIGGNEVARDLAVSAAELSSDFREHMEGTLSSGATSRTRASSARASIREQQSDLLMARDIARGEDPIVAGLARIGRGVIDGVTNITDDPTVLAQSTSDAVGSILSGSVIAQGLKRAGIGATSQAGVAGTASIAAQESGGVYSEIVNEVMGMTHDQLYALSPDYVELLDQDVDRDEAKRRIASDAATAGGLAMLPAAAAIGRLSARFIENPLSVRGANRALTTVLAAEPAEEALQGGVGAAVANLAIQQHADPTRSGIEGVGEGIGEGAVLGVTGAGALQAPGAVLTGAATVAGEIGNAINTMGDALREANDASSPVSEAKVRAAVNTAQENAETIQEAVVQAINESDADPEVKAAATQRIGQLATALAVNPEQDAPAFFGEKIVDIVTNAEDKADAIFLLAKEVQKAQDPEEAVIIGAAINNIVGNMAAFEDQNADIIAELDPESPVKQAYDLWVDTIHAVAQSPTVVRAIQASMPQEQVSEVTEQTVDTPEGQRSVAANIAAAETDPSKGSLTSYQTILNRANEGKLQLTDRQRVSLESAVALLRAEQEVAQQAEQQGRNSPSDLVSREIRTSKADSRTGKHSARTHARGIVDALRAGKTEDAALLMQQFGNFVQHMQNKVEAINDHYSRGAPSGAENRSTFQAWDGAEWYQTPTGVGVTPTHENSVSFAQYTHDDANMVMQVYANLAAAFPQLNAQAIQPVSLDQSLLAPVSEVVAKHKAPSRQPVQPTQPQTQEPEPTVAPVSRITPEQAGRLSDGGLNTRLDNLIQKRTDGTATPEDEATFAVLDAEMSRREDAAAAATTQEQEQELTPEPAQEPEPTTEPETQADPVAETEPETTPVPRRTGISSVYPNLVYMDNNNFLKSFSFPTSPISRIAADESPLETLRSVLDNKESLSEWLGEDLRKEYSSSTAKEFQNLLEMVGVLSTGAMDAINARLDREIKSGVNKGKTLRDLLNSGDPTVLRYRNTRLFNLLERDGDVYQINKSLLESASLAAAQWYVQFKDYERENNVESIAELLDMQQYQVTDGMLNFFNFGTSQNDAILSLADKISKYWGLRGHRTASESYVKGIPEAMASQLIEVMRSNKLLETSNASFEVEDRKFRMTRYAAKPLKEGSPIYRFPDAIDTAVLVDREYTKYIGKDAVPETARTQLRNNMIRNTPEDLKAIENADSTEYRLNLDTFNLFSSFGRDGLVRLFGEQYDNLELLHPAHRKSVEGINRSLADTLNHMRELVQEIQSNASAEGTELTDTVVRFKHNMTRTARLQQIGKYVPQSNKLMREVLLPTWSTINVNATNTRTYRGFRLAQAQALGVKIHNINHRASLKEVNKLFKKDLAPAVQAMKDWFIQYGSDVAQTIESEIIPTEIIDTLIDTFASAGIELSPVALHAVMEQAKFELATPEQRRNFRTALYLEADGVSNGPINAIRMFTTDITPEFLKRMRRGGMNIGFRQTMAELFSKDSDDTYKVGADNLTKVLSELMANPRGKITGATQGREAILTILSELTSGISQGEGDKFVFTRNVIKNPLTILIYGSGIRGVAGNFLDSALDELFKRMSDFNIARASGAENPGSRLVPNSSDAADTYRNLQRAFNYLANNKYMSPRPFAEAIMIPVDNPQKVDLSNTRGFELTSEQYEAIQHNITYLFASPLLDAITEAIGVEVMEGSSLVRQATQVQSIIAKNHFDSMMKARLEARSKETGIPTSQEFLSQADMDEIYQSLLRNAPPIKLPTQTLFVGSSERADLGIPDYSFGSSVSGSTRATARINGPVNAGVRGIPYVVIGAGDGRAIQHYMTDGDAPDRSLPIFDGINLPMDMYEEWGRKANEAILTSWDVNVYEAVKDSYVQSLSSMDRSSFVEGNALDLARALGVRVKNGKITPKVLSEINKSLDLLESNLERKRQNKDKQNIAINKFYQSTDQMAGTATPAIREGIEFSAETSVEDIASRMTSELDSIESEETVPKTDLIMVGGVVDEDTGARVFTSGSLDQILETLKTTYTQAELLKQISNIQSVEDYTIVIGNREQVENWQKNNGMQISDPEAYEKGSVYGFTNHSDKVIYLHNATAETLAHELVHAATLEALVAHYTGQKLGTRGPVIAAAITRIEQLMEQFLSLDDTLMTDRQREAYQNTKSVIEGYLAQDDGVGNAQAVNEFMAWGLTNPDLETVLGYEKAHPIVRIAREVVKSLMRLVFGRDKSIPKPLNDMLSNLHFNTAVIMETQPTLFETRSPLVSYQSLNYGTNGRIASLDQAFSNAIIGYSKKGKEVNGTPDQKIAREIDAAQMKAIELGEKAQEAGFSLTPQERGLFHNLIALLNIQPGLDPIAVSRAQQIFDHMLEHLEVDSFLADPENYTSPDLYYANTMYDYITGLGTDGLPVFIALATVNQDLRDALRRLPAMKLDKDTERTLDAAINNAANGGMEWMNRTLSGQGKVKDLPNVMDALVNQFYNTAQEQKTFIEVADSKVQDGIDGINDWVISQAQRASDSIKGWADRTKDDPQVTRVKRFAATVSEGLGNLLTEENTAHLAEGVTAAMNRLKISQPMRDLGRALLGRSESNAGIYDLIKVVKAGTQQTRQQFREQLPLIITSKFNRELSDSEWSDLTTGLMRTDIAALVSGSSLADALSSITDERKRSDMIAELEESLNSADRDNWDLLRRKAKELAKYMVTGEPSTNLLTNANAVANLLNHNIKYRMPGTVTQDFINKVDRLITLYAVDTLSEDTRNTVKNLIETEREGTDFVLAYLQGQRIDEIAKGNQGRARFNYYKGHTPFERTGNEDLILRPLSEHSDLLAMSYKMVKMYQGSNLDTSKQKYAYYYSSVPSRNRFQQGLIQNVRPTAFGVNRTTGFSEQASGGMITNSAMVEAINKRIQRGEQGVPLKPIFSEGGRVIAYERIMEHDMLQMLKPNQDIRDLIAIRQGRQIEEYQAGNVNNAVVDNAFEMWERDRKQGKEAEYQNILDPDYLATDPVVADAVALFTPETTEAIQERFGETFMVRRDLLTDIAGYRQAGLGDFWTGTSRWDAKTQERVKNLALGVMGNKAYQYLINAESVWKDVIGMAKDTIVVRSVIVPAINIISNIYQLLGRGVPITTMAREIPRKMTELNQYLRMREQEIKLQADLSAEEITGNQDRIRILNARLGNIRDGYKRLSIWPLINAGEFSTVVDVGRTRGDLELTNGRMAQYLEAKIDALPAPIRAAGRYAFITQDTALYQGLQKSIQFGDFLAKAVYYEHLRKRKGLNNKDSLARITEEFINYDRLPGRFRGTLEAFGLVWFMNFKLGAAKVGLSMLRNNPVHALIAMALPGKDVIGNSGIPVTENIFAKIWDGTMGYSLGPGMALRAPNMNPWVQLSD